MKKPEYKINDHVEFECNGKKYKGFLRYYYDGNPVIKTRKGITCLMPPENIIRKLPILRDSRGRFSKKSTVTIHEIKDISKVRFVAHDGQHDTKCKCYKPGKTIEELIDEKWARETPEPPAYLKRVKKTKKEKDCTCYNCSKCEAWMKDYYEKTEDGKYKITEYLKSKKTEEKKPSDIIEEKVMNNKYKLSRHSVFLAAILEYLDECWEKGRK